MLVMKIILELMMKSKNINEILSNIFLLNYKGNIINKKNLLLWITDNEAYARGTYCNPLSINKNVLYEILCPAEAKIIQANYGVCSNGMFTEGIYPRTSKLKVISNELKDGILRLRCELLPQ